MRALVRDITREQLIRVGGHAVAPVDEMYRLINQIINVHVSTDCGDLYIMDDWGGYKYWFHKSWLQLEKDKP